MNQSDEQIDEALENALKRHFSQAVLPQEQEPFIQKVLFKIGAEKHLRNLKVKLWSALGILAATLATLAFALEISFKAFAQTPASNFLALMFTDFGAVVSNWQDYGYSLLETLPLGTLAFLLAAVLASAILGEYVIFQWQDFRKSIIH